MKNVFVFFSISLLILSTVRSQWISQMNITPATPTVNEFITLHYDAYFPSSGCALLTQNVSIIGNNITVDAQHEQGMVTVICNGSETIPIGYLPMGI